MSEIIAILVGGLVVGAVARLALPGRQGIGCVGTIAVGVVGGLIGGFIGNALFAGGDGGFYGGGSSPLLGFGFSVLGAVLVLLLLQALRRR